MGAIKPRVLLVEDAGSLRAVYTQYLQKGGFEVDSVATGEACLIALAQSAPSALVLDLGLPDVSGLEILKKVTTHSSSTAVVVITSNASLDIAVDAMRHGAFDFVAKPFNAARLCATVGNAVEQSLLKAEVRAFRSGLQNRGHHVLVGNCDAMRTVYRTIESVARSRASVFITGESGTGKEVCATALHAASDRRSGALIAINCAAIPRELMESEIFGHVKGAFTGATSARVGAAALADNGTLFLDEICEMDLDLQAKLLRLLQDGTFSPVGSSKIGKSDLRIICATNRDPMTEVAAGRFREDLFYRLHVVPLHLPPLRERGDDVLELAARFLEQCAVEEDRPFASISADAKLVIRTYSWPGNIRELQNAIRNAVVLNHGTVLEASMLPPAVRGASRRPAAPSSLTAGQMPSPSPRILPLWQLEREALQNALEVCAGNVTRAAALLEIGVSTLYRKKAELGLVR
jgi:two-component system repressor protein LuxO